jgi:hypothetical protein
MGGGCATLRPMSQTDPWAALARATGAAGLAGIVLLFVPIIAITTLGEREFDATREEVAAFFRNMAESSWADVADTVVVFGLVALTWFMVGLCLLLRRAEGDPPWRSTVALVFEALFAAYLLTNASLQAAGNRADIDPSLGQSRPPAAPGMRRPLRVSAHQRPGRAGFTPKRSRPGTD